MVDRNSPVPIYYQLYLLIKSEIEDGNYNPEEYLPSENEYSEKYNISRLTVRQALRKLVENGLVETQKGKGTRVLFPKNVTSLTHLKSFTEEAESSGHKAGSIVIENRLIDIPPEARSVMKLPDKSKVILLKRLRLLDEIPFAIESAYINTGTDVRILTLLGVDMTNRSLYRYIERNLDVSIEYADETIEISRAIPEIASLLKITENDSVMLRKRFTYTKDSRCFEYVKSFYRGDRYKFNVRIYAR